MENEKYFELLYKKGIKKVSKTKKNNIKLTIIEKEVKKDISYEITKEYCSKYSKGEGSPLINFIVPNSNKPFFVISLNQKSENLMRFISRTSENLYFLNEHIDYKQNVRDYIEEKYFSFLCMNNNEMVTIFSKKNLKCGENYWIKAMEIPFKTNKKDMNSLIPSIENKYIAVQCSIIEEEFDSLIDVIPKIKTLKDFALVWNFTKERPMHSMETAIIIEIASWWSKEGNVGLNLTAIGDADSRKSSYLHVISWMTGESIVDGALSSEKGILPSFHEKGSANVFIENKKEVLIDEFFKGILGRGIVENRHNRYQQLVSKMASTTNILHRQPYDIRAGTGFIKTIFKNPFLTADNLELHEELKKIFYEFNSIAKRHVFVDTMEWFDENKLENLSLDIAKKKLMKIFSKVYGEKETMALMEKTRLYKRTKIGKCKYEEKKVNDISKKMMDISNERIKEMQKNPTTRKPALHIQQWITPLIEGIIINNTLIRHNSHSLPAKFIAHDEDYFIFEILLNKLCFDNWNVWIEKENPFSWIPTKW